MPNLLIHNARCVATLDHTDPALARELPHTSILIRNHRIAFIGPAADLPADALAADEVIDARRHLVTPAWSTPTTICFRA